MPALRVLACLLAALLLPAVLTALDGDLRVHDPSTIAECAGRYYVFSTGPNIPILVSDDAFTWRRAGQVFDKIPDSVKSVVPLNDGHLVWAPDVIRQNGAYFLYYSVSSWGSNVSAIGLLTNPTLNSTDPAYKWTDRGVVVNSVKGENLNAIDPGVMRAPDGTLWLTYGSYIGNVQLVELDPQTGLRIAKNSPAYILSSASEASELISHDGYFYLYVNRGSCCKGRESGYNIRVGRSRTPTGPYLDRYGVDMAHGGGTLFLAAEGQQIGPGHFSLFLFDGVEKFSCHYEADLTRGGRSTLGIRPLLWTLDGWPEPGSDVIDGAYQLRSRRFGSVLENAAATTNQPTTLHLGAYMTHENQQWTVSAAGGGFYKIVELNTTGALTSGPGLQLTPFAGGANQLWKIDELPDGTYRIKAKETARCLAVDNEDSHVHAAALATCTGGDLQRWTITRP